MIYLSDEILKSIINLFNGVVQKTYNWILIQYLYTPHNLLRRFCRNKLYQQENFSQEGMLALMY